ncbi:AGE family epimerase/isomerase [Emticicia sp. BO119]|uniref:AGE family epimerase/isomerase n=1 Tax=Emticicia sp. BO119 TaxID=2757768 RepID=UPI0015F07C7D|nr:AGE family epimerase/isomerase [Emticicia sp. BO119]MBA4849977.1 AGE family epimerase/isomerase [Emticicia sp. BO119]
MDLKTFRSEVETELNNILNFWITNAIDKEHGGFYGKITADDKIVKDAEKGLVLNSRILWTFSAAYLYQPIPIYREVAKRAYDYLLEHFWDKKNSGGYWSVDYQGNPKEIHKQIYGQGFMLYGFSEYYRAFHDRQALDKAIELFQILEHVAFDPKHGGYYEVTTADWKIIQDNVITQGKQDQKKSMNTHLHIIEPFTNLYRVWKNEHLAKQIKGLLGNFIEHIVDRNTFTQHLFFDDDWTVKSDIVSFGHDIESSWLLVEAAEVLGDKKRLEQIRRLAVQIARASEKGLDTDGGMFNEQDNHHLNKEKHWWVQAEAMVGFLNAYEISKQKEFLDHSVASWNFIKKSLITTSGEWYWGIDENNKPMLRHDKAGFWKCPYHNARACMEVIRRLS